MIFENDRTHFQVLENYAALPLQGHEEDWKQLMQLLGLRVDHLGAVHSVLGRGRWRNANDPVGYIRSAVQREHRKLERPKRPRALAGCISEMKLPSNQDGTPMEHDEAVDLLNAVPLEGQWDTSYAKQRVQRKFLIADSPHHDAEYTIDYSKLMDEVALIAGLSTPRRNAIEKVLVLRSTVHLSREQLSSYPDEGERKRLLAALKWIERNKPLLAKVLSGRQ